VSILGNRVLRKEDPKFLTVGGTYVDDIALPGAAYVTYVRSTVPHALIRGIEVSAAKAAPGVIEVVVGADVDLEPLAPPMAMINPAMTRPLLATDRVRFVGEPVAAIVSEARYQGADAAELVVVDYEPLPVLLDLEASRRGDVLLFPGLENNVSLEMAFGRDESLFDDCPVVVRQTIVNQRVAPCPLEPRAAAAQWGDDGRLTFWVSTQVPHGNHKELAAKFGMDPGQVRLIAPDVGGGFGSKIGGYPEEILVAWLARRAGRPLKWAETRSESMLGLVHGRAQVQHAELGGRRDGTFVAYRLTVTQDSGAYPNMGALLPFLTRTMVSGVYEIPKVEFNSVSLVTNTTPLGAYRGAGRPEATAAIERIVDVFAAEIGMDPIEVRRKNVVPPDAFPYTTKVGTVYDSGDYGRALDLAAEAAGYAKLRREQARRRKRGDVCQLGIGVSVYVEITGGAAPNEFAAIEVLLSGRAVVRTGTSPHGQGHATAWAMLASARTGIPIEMIDVVYGDTDLVPRGEGTMASRSLQQGGMAVDQAAVLLVDKARQLAADLLEANPDDVVLDQVAGAFHVTGTPAVNKTWAELAAAASTRSAATPGGLPAESGLSAETDFRAPGPSYPFGCHIVVVEVDTETGQVSVKRVIAVDDAGRLLNPMLAEGQVHGGLAQGIAQALMEEFRYDEDGNPQTTNLADYTFVSAAELPSFETVHMETPSPVNELGAKGIGESGTIGSTPAAQNAVIDALAHLGVRHIDMPTTPERVWRALAEAQAEDKAARR